MTFQEQSDPASGHTQFHLMRVGTYWPSMIFRDLVSGSTSGIYNESFKTTGDKPWYWTGDTSNFNEVFVRRLSNPEILS